MAEVEAGLKRILVARHGAEDFTVTPQRKMLEVFGTLLDAITFAVAAIGATRRRVRVLFLAEAARLDPLEAPRSE